MNVLIENLVFQGLSTNEIVAAITPEIDALVQKRSMEQRIEAAIEAAKTALANGGTEDDIKLAASTAFGG
jgi:hypothetical protein